MKLVIYPYIILILIIILLFILFTGIRQLKSKNYKRNLVDRKAINKFEINIYLNGIISNEKDMIFEEKERKKN